MRRRSFTLHADSVEEYVLKATDPLTQTYGPYAPVKRTNSKKKINASSLLPLLLTEDQSPSSATKPKKESFESLLQDSPDKKGSHWADFDFSGPLSIEVGCESLEQKSSWECDKQMEINSCVTASTDDTLDSSPSLPLRTTTRKFMVIGSSGSGRHSLVNSIFDSQGKEKQSSLRQTMDLIIHKRVEDECEVKYQFWMRALNDHRFDGLVKVYYRNASVFFFVYSVTNRESFEILSEAIEAVQKEVPKEKFTGILLGNKCDLEKQRKVSFEEGTSLKERFNLSLFLETNKGDQISKNKLFSFLHQQ